MDLLYGKSTGLGRGAGGSCIPHNSLLPPAPRGMGDGGNNQAVTNLKSNCESLSVEELCMRVCVCDCPGCIGGCEHVCMCCEICMHVCDCPVCVCVYERERERARI